MPATISTSANVTRINLSGDFDFSTQEALNGVFEQALSANAKELCLDLQETRFIDSSVIRLFLKLHETTKRRNQPLMVVNCNPRILEILSIGGFDQIFDIR